VKSVVRRAPAWARRLALLLVGALAACAGGPAGPPAAPADITVLMLGNSHSAWHDLPGQLQALLRAGLAGKTVSVQEAPGWMYLDQRLQHGPTLKLLQGRRWTVVVLQAQRYSSSGRVNHATEPAQALVRLARQAGALPVLFPEWPRRGIDETQRIHDAHVAIARQQPACVAPVGQAWDLALQRGWALHDADGNHANAAGAFLTALVLYATVTGASPRELPALPGGLPVQKQAQLRQLAAEALQADAPRLHCPQDRPWIPG
jgi:hypothetical protein